MKVVITHSKAYGFKLKNIFKSAMDAGEKEITLLSTSEIQDDLLKILDNTQAAKRFKVSSKIAFMVKGILIELETIDSYE